MAKSHLQSTESHSDAVTLVGMHKRMHSHGMDEFLICTKFIFIIMMI